MRGSIRGYLIFLTVVTVVFVAVLTANSNDSGSAQAKEKDEDKDKKEHVEKKVDGNRQTDNRNVHAGLPTTFPFPEEPPEIPDYVLQQMEAEPVEEVYTVNAIAAAPSSPKIDDSGMMYQLVGNHAEVSGIPLTNYTSDMWVYGTDLAIPYYNSYYNKVVFAFGDTFGPDSPTGCWDPIYYRFYPGRCNTRAWQAIALTDDLNPSGGIYIPPSGWVINSTGLARSVVRPCDFCQSSVPTSGWSPDGSPRQYLWIMHILDWESVPIDIYDTVLVYTENNWDTWSEPGPNFPPGSKFSAVPYMFLNDKPGGDGKLYIFGSPYYRSLYNGVYLARVEPSQITDINQYEYYSGNGDNFTADERYAVPLSKLNRNTWLYPYFGFGELSVMWNNYLQKYIMLYLYADSDVFLIQRVGQIAFAYADNPWGPWTKTSDPAFECYDWASDRYSSKYRNCYGSYMLNEYTADDGKTIYPIMSRMTEGGTAILADCDEYPWPCNEVYNPFQMYVTFK